MLIITAVVATISVSGASDLALLSSWTNSCRSLGPKQHAQTDHFNLTKHNDGRRTRHARGTPMPRTRPGTPRHQTRMAVDAPAPRRCHHRLESLLKTRYMFVFLDPVLVSVDSMPCTIAAFPDGTASSHTNGHLHEERLSRTPYHFAIPDGTTPPTTSKQT